MVAFVPPRRLRADGVAEGEPEKTTHGRDTCSNNVVDPAVPGSALYSPGS
jgi:hypothetical protein